VKTNRTVAALVAVYLIVLLIVVAEKGSALEQGTVLRGRGLELSDPGGQIRVRINMEPTGEVVFRLYDKTGTIRVKIGASENGSGLVLLNDSTEVGVQFLANEKGSTLKVTENGRERVVTP
jgi:hypothetical protein